MPRVRLNPVRHDIFVAMAASVVISCVVLWTLYDWHVVNEWEVLTRYPTRGLVSLAVVFITYTGIASFRLGSHERSLVFLVAAALVGLLVTLLVAAPPLLLIACRHGDCINL